MNTKRALRLALYYRVLSAVSLVAGLGIALVGLSVGLGETLSILASDFPSRTDEAMAAANLPVALGAAVAGVLVWQVGKWAAFFRTIGKVVAEPASGAPSEPPRDEPTAAAEGRAAESGADPSVARQDPIVPSSPSGSADESASPGTDSGGLDDRASDPDGRGEGGPLDDDATADDPIGGTASADDGPVPGDGPATGSRTGSPRPHEGEDDGSAATLADDADNVFDGDAADAPADAVTCGDCGYPNKEGVSFCANCGAEL